MLERSRAHRDIQLRTHTLPAPRFSERDPVRDLTPVVMIAEAPIVRGASPQFGPNNTKELFGLGRKAPGKLTYAYGSGSAQVAAAKLVDMGGIETVGVAYKGSPQALTDVMSRKVAFMFVDLSLAVPPIKGGTLTIGRASVRERGWQYVEITVVALS